MQSNEYFVWQAAALKAASAAIQKEALSLLRDRQMSAEDKLVAVKAMLVEQGRIEGDYLKAMANYKG